MAAQESEADTLLWQGKLAQEVANLDSEYRSLMYGGTSTTQVGACTTQVACACTLRRGRGRGTGRRKGPRALCTAIVTPRRPCWSALCVAAGGGRLHRGSSTAQSMEVPFVFVPMQEGALFTHPVEAASFSSSDFADLFFKAEGCMRTDGSACATPDSQYYEVTHHGLDVMMRRVLAEMTLLTKDAPADCTYNNTRYMTMYSIGGCWRQHAYTLRVDCARTPTAATDTCSWTMSHGERAHGARGLLICTPQPAPLALACAPRPCVCPRFT